jgi:hypothetical protein
MGAATGPIVLTARPDGGQDMAGITIANAVRLEGASRPGALLIDVPTFDGLSPSIAAAYPVEEVAAGKHGETFRARRCVFDSDDGGAAPPVAAKKAAGDIREILKLFGQLYPQDKLDTLMHLLNMPPQYQPSKVLNYAERRNAVLDWAKTPAGPGLPQLESDLRFVIENEGT